MRHESHRPEHVILTQHEQQVLAALAAGLRETEARGARARRLARSTRPALIGGSRHLAGRFSRQPWITGLLLVVAGLTAVMVSLSTSLPLAVAGALLTTAGIGMVTSRVAAITRRRPPWTAMPR